MPPPEAAKPPEPPFLAVVIDLASTTREGAIDELLRALETHPAVADANLLAREVRAREARESTYLGHGAALPHARTDAVLRILLAAGRSRRGIGWGGNDFVHWVFLIAVPGSHIRPYLLIVKELSAAVRRGRLDPLLGQELPGDELRAAFEAALRG